MVSRVKIPPIQVFHPTWDEFKDFERYLHHIENLGAQEAGICKIVAPSEYKPRKSGYSNLDRMEIDGPLEQKFIGRSGVYMAHLRTKKNITAGELRKLAQRRPHATPDHEDWAHLERKYWANLSMSSPIYGADVSGTITDKDCNHWNIARLPSILEEVLRRTEQRIDGVNTPYLYFGTWMATFPWHTEDCELYSINYIHNGMPKQWYSIPPAYARKFESLTRELFKTEYLKCSAFLRHKVFMISPQVLRENGIPVNSITHEQGEFIITFPYGYHAGFNLGYNIAESTNFAMKRWIDFGKQTLSCLCRPDTVRIDMTPFVKAYQLHLLLKWKKGEDPTEHPLLQHERTLLMMNNIRFNKDASLPVSRMPPVRWYSNLPLCNAVFGSDSAQRRGRKRLLPSNQERPMSRASQCDDSSSSAVQSFASDEVRRTNKITLKPKEQLNVIRHKCPSSAQRIIDEAIASEKDPPDFLDPHWRSLWSPIGSILSCEEESPATATVIPLVEKTFNERLSHFSPHCSLCSVLWTPGKRRDIICSVNRSAVDYVQQLPLKSSVLMPETAFLKTSGTRSDAHVHGVSQSPRSIRQQRTVETAGTGPDHETDNLEDIPMLCPTEHEELDGTSFDSEKDEQAPEEEPSPASNGTGFKRHLEAIWLSDESYLLQCSTCHVAVHARCYGVTERTAERIATSADRRWQCERCRKECWSAQCVVCPYRGGALKRLAHLVAQQGDDIFLSRSNSQWIHLQCAVATWDIQFPLVKRRIAQLPAYQSTAWSSLRCQSCRLSNHRAPLAKCIRSTCNSHLHITCAQFSRVLIETDNFPWPIYLTCKQHAKVYAEVEAEQVPSLRRKAAVTVTAAVKDTKLKRLGKGKGGKRPKLTGLDKESNYSGSRKTGSGSEADNGDTDAVNGNVSTDMETKSSAGALKSSDAVWALHPRQDKFYRAKLLKMVAPCYYSIRFADGSYCERNHVNSICNWDHVSQGPPQKGMQLEVRWDDGRIFAGSYIGHFPEVWRVEFRHGIQFDVDRTCIYGFDEELPL